MSDSIKGLPPLHRFADAEWEALYVGLGGYLQGKLTRLFAIPEEDAHVLVRDFFFVSPGLEFLPRDAHRWVIGGVCRSAMAYLERRGLATGRDLEEEIRAMEEQLLWAEALAMLSERDRAVLRLRFEERKTPFEIAAELGVTPRFAKQILDRAEAKLRRLIQEKKGR